jgi:hypothetical protein
MADSRGARCSDTDQVKIYVDGLPLPSRDRKDMGCLGDVHIFSATTTLSEPVTYAWYIDSAQGTPVSTKSFYGYTFDDEQHTIILRVGNSKCTIASTIKAKGVSCSPCVTKCVTQTAYFPAGRIVALIDETQKAFYIDDGELQAECRLFSKANKIGAKAITRTIRMISECKSTILNAQLFYNKQSPNCLTLNIINSPIKFLSIQIGSTKYPFQGC